MSGASTALIPPAASAAVPGMPGALAVFAAVPGMPVVPGGRSLVPQWFVPALKALGVLIVVEVLVNDSGASMAVLSAACAAPLLLALAAARLQASVR